MDEIILKSIENDHRITRKTDSEFLYAFQKAVLLALLEDGTLTEMQYRYAEEKLRKQIFWASYIRKATIAVRKSGRRWEMNDSSSKLLPRLHG